MNKRQRKKQVQRNTLGPWNIKRVIRAIGKKVLKEHRKTFIDLSEM